MAAKSELSVEALLAYNNALEALKRARDDLRSEADSLYAVAEELWGITHKQHSSAEELMGMDDYATLEELRESVHEYQSLIDRAEEAKRTLDEAGFGTLAEKLKAVYDGA